KLKGQSGHYKSIELGQMVERALIAESEKEAEAITTEISSVALQQTKGKIFGELMFLNLAVLVNDQRESQLDQLVNEAAEKRKGKVQFKYIGPAPPASFVDIHLKF
ncbi:MAG: GvpL/GvpF family gas vesicle protein, partial [bacterium]